MRLIALLVSAVLALPAVALACDRENAPTTAALAPLAPVQASLVTLRMESVDCGSCIVPIRKELTALSGVLSVEGNAADVKEVLVSVEADKVTTEQLVAAVKKAGYDAVVKPAAKNS